MNGVINFLKPPGMSSNGAVVYLRAMLGGIKTGHAGTLDPGACGVLPICAGKATKISSCLMGEAKEYIAEVTFGKSTDTGDSYGKITASSAKALPNSEEVERALGAFVGTTVQQTPAYSAAKYHGRTLYSLAREGAELPSRFRSIEIYELEYLHMTRPGAHLLRVACGKGTYIRTLCEDLGVSFGIPAYMSLLIRTKCAGLDIADAFTAEELAAEGALERALIPTDSFLKRMPAVKIDARKRTLLYNGGTVEFDGEDIEEVRVYAEDEFLGIGNIVNSRLKIKILLTDRQEL